MILRKFATLEYVTTHYNLTEKQLNELVANKQLSNFTLDESTIIYSLEEINDYVAAQISRDQFVHLKDKVISITQASWKYHIQQGTISKWLARGWIKEISSDGKQKFINEQDIAYLKAVSEAKQMRSGMRLPASIAA